jgi:hypothetical protein
MRMEGFEAVADLDGAGHLFASSGEKSHVGSPFLFSPA